MASTELAADSSGDRRREQIVLLILAAVQFTTIVDFMIVMPLGPQLMRTMNIDTAQFGLVVSSYTFAAGIAGLIASAIADRFARRTTFMVLYAGFLIGTFCCALAPDYRMLMLARFITGAFGGILAGMSMAIIGDVFPEERRGRATGWLMTGFALASVFGVPMGLFLGSAYGWHVPFVALAIVGSPALFITPFAMSRLDGHVGKVHAHPLRSMAETFSHVNHLKAFALIVMLMLGSFTVWPLLPAYLEANVGMDEKTQLPWVYVVGGVLTLFTSPIVGKIADQYGKLIVYRVLIPISAVLLIVITHLPPSPMYVSLAVFGLLMVCNVGRMIAAMAMVTSSVVPQRRGAFLSANASVQHIASGLGAFLGTLIVSRAADGKIEHFGTVGWVAAAATLSTVWIASRIRVADQSPVSAEAMSFAAAAEATADAGEPMFGYSEMHG